LIKQKQILLVGRSGFIGSYLHDKFKDDYRITSVGYSSGLIEDDFHQLDLTKEKDVEIFSKQLPSCDILIFLVGLAHKKGNGKDFNKFQLVNKQTLINIVSMLQNINKLPRKLIFASTISIYGEKIDRDIYHEDSSKEPFSPYALTKLDAENFLLKNFGTQSWILRFAPVYAPDFQLNIKRRTRVFGKFYRVGNGKKKLSLCNVENILEVVKGIFKEKVPPGIYNISDGNKYSYNDLLDYVNAKWVVHIPTFLVKGLYVVGKMMNNIFLKENATKLISDNVFPSYKIRQYIELPYTLKKTNQITITNKTNKKI